MYALHWEHTNMAGVLDMSTVSLDHSDQDVDYNSDDVKKMSSQLVQSLKDFSYAVIENCGIPASKVS